MDFLALPRDFAADPLWGERPGWLRAYLDLQLQATAEPALERVERQEVRLQPGELIFSNRKFGDRWGMSRREVGDFMRYLERREMVGYPEGQEFTRPYRVRLWDAWCLGQAESAAPQRTPLATRPPAVPSPEPLGTPERTTPPQVGQPPELALGAPLGTPEVPKNGNGKGAHGKTLGTKRRVKPEAVDDAADVPGEQVQALMVLLHRIGLHETALFTGGLWAKQAVVVKRMIHLNGYDATEAAIRGMRSLFPWDQPSAMPFDAFQVEKHAPRALTAWGRRHAERQEHEGRQEDRRQRETRAEEAKQAYDADLHEWQARIRHRLKELSAVDLGALQEEAKRETMTVPGMSAEGAAKLLRATVYRIFGERVDDPPPTLPR